MNKRSYRDRANSETVEISFVIQVAAESVQVLLS